MKVGDFLRVILLTLFTEAIYSQGLQLEPMAGNTSFYYQHVAGLEVDEDSKIALINISSVTARYDKMNYPELMSQVYLARPLYDGLNLGLGLIYVSGPGLRPSAMMQFLKTTRHLSFVLFPRVDLWKNPSVELMTIMEYRPKLSSKLYGYSRIQLQTIWSKGYHLKSSQHLRVGLGMRGIQYGLALVLDEYGAKFATYQNYGFFIRKEISASPGKGRVGSSMQQVKMCDVK